MQGWSDSPLTEYGQATATKVGQALANTAFDYYYSSDSKRAIDTAQLIRQAAGATVQPFKTLMNFREVFYGYFEGDDSSRTWSLVGRQYGVTSMHELLEHVPIDQTRDLMREIDPWHEAEDNSMYWERINQGFDYLKAHHDHHQKSSWLPTARQSAVWSHILLLKSTSRTAPKTGASLASTSMAIKFASSIMRKT